MENGKQRVVYQNGEFVAEQDAKISIYDRSHQIKDFIDIKVFQKINNR
jgi:hypothetical protein